MLVCENYRSDSHKAPVQIGHVDSQSPAYGWIEKVRYDKKQGVLYAVISYIDEAVDFIKRQLYKFVSVTFYPPNCNNHPKQGHGFYLKSLALLGGQPPAIKGLPELSFCDGDDDSCVTCDIASDNLPEDVFEAIAEVKDDVDVLQRRIRQLEIENEKIQLKQYIDGLYRQGNITPAIIDSQSLMSVLLASKGYSDEACYSEGENLHTTLISLLNSLRTVSYSESTELKQPLVLTGDEMKQTPHERAIKLVNADGLKYRDALKKAMTN
jgi:hypothetical protein